MGQKINPISNRLGIIKGWDSNWIGDKKRSKNYGDTILEDYKLRKYVEAFLEKDTTSKSGSDSEQDKRRLSEKEKNKIREKKASVSRIVIERTLKLITVTICTAKPGMIIGKAGADVENLKEELKKFTDKEVQINIFEIKKPELDAVVVANSIARQVEGKVAYRRAVKAAVTSTMRAGAEGIKIQVSGRLNGAEMARSEMYKEGRTPLHTFRADIDYAQAEALTKVGIIGIKVWICRGEIYGKKDLAPQYTSYRESGRPSGSSREGRGGFRKKRNK